MIEMGAVYFTREITDSLIQITYELKRMNDLKEKELQTEYGGKVLKEE